MDLAKSGQKKSNDQMISNIKYNVLDEIQHVLTVPEMYISNVTPSIKKVWTVETHNGITSVQKNKKVSEIISQNTIVRRDINFAEGFVKIFDEILINAVDHYVVKENGVTYIKVNINDSVISVSNNGTPIPVAKFQGDSTQGLLNELYNPEILFGQLRSSSHYNKKDKIESGTYGLGAVLTNIFSSVFEVKVIDTFSELVYVQKWEKNMSVKYPPVIRAIDGESLKKLRSVVKGKDKNFEIKKRQELSMVKITFMPDFARFKIKDPLDNSEIFGLLKKRCFEVAACNPGLNIYLNEQLLHLDFLGFAKLFDFESPILPRESIEYVSGGNNDWSYVLFPTQVDNSVVTYVNNNVVESGIHITHFFNLLSKTLKPIIMKKLGKDNTMIQSFTQYLRNHVTVFISATIKDAKFDSQAKTKLVLQKNQEFEFIEFEKSFITSLLKSSLVENMINSVQNKISKKIFAERKKTSLKITKLLECNFASIPSKRKDAVLIICEGDSAKTLCISGISSIPGGRDKYAVFPLKGKLLNVRDAKAAQILKNEEIKNLISIIGLQELKPDNPKSGLRYGKLMIMTDQDQDGSHIKGLIINFIAKYNPELLVSDFLTQFITPIVKVTIGKEVISFFSIQDYNDWISRNGDKKFSVKYYKGLGTSTSREAEEYFKNIQKHVISFASIDIRKDLNLIDMIFSKKRASERKTWLENYALGLEAGVIDKILYKRDENKNKIEYSEFFNEEFIHFSNTDNVRSIPNLVDGLKPSQRKILYTCMDLPEKEYKVEQLSGFISTKTFYHHGEESLKMAIINMAHDYVGSNNMNILEPIGQFGTRLLGGKDSAQPRYISTKLTEMAKIIFNKEDNNILIHNEEENNIIEPQHYLPIVPMILINGGKGIGTGWSTFIPNFSPIQIIEKIRLRLHNKIDNIPLIPFYKSFKGIITKNSPSSFITIGRVYTSHKTKEVLITELPIGNWSQTYIAETLPSIETKKGLQFEKITDNNTDKSVWIKIKLSDESYHKLESEPNGFFIVLKLVSKLSTNNMVCFDLNNKIHIFKNPEHIFDIFYNYRLQKFNERKEYQLKVLEKKCIVAENKARFIRMKCDDKIKIEKIQLVKIIEQLVKFNFSPDPFKESENYDYLTHMPIYSLTTEKIAELEKQAREAREAIEILKKTKISDIWESELDKLVTAYKKDFETKTKPLPAQIPVSFKEIFYDIGVKDLITDAFDEPDDCKSQASSQ